MGKFIEETYPTIKNKANEWWENYGLLNEHISDDTKALIVIALESTAMYLANSNYMEFKKEARTYFLPLITRIFRKTEGKTFQYKEVKQFVKIIIEDFAEKFENKKGENNDEFFYRYFESFDFNKLIKIQKFCNELSEKLEKTISFEMEKTTSNFKTGDNYIIYLNGEKTALLINEKKLEVDHVMYDEIVKMSIDFLVKQNF